MINKLGSLLDFGFDCMERQKINVIKLKGAKKVFYPMMVAAHSYTEAVFVLCKEHRTPPSSALLRSLCDNLINAKFLFCNPTKNVYVIYLDALIEKRKQLNHAQEFLELNPEWGPKNNLTIKDIRKSLKNVQKQEKRMRAKIDSLSVKPITDTLLRAKYVDKHNAAKNEASASLEGYYILLFRTLSASTHINFLDFRRYFEQNGSETIVLLSGNSNETPLIAALAEFFYKEMLWMFLKIFKSSLLKEFETSYRIDAKKPET